MKTNLVDSANQHLDQQNPQLIPQPVLAPYNLPNVQQSYPVVQNQIYFVQPVDYGTQNLLTYNKSLKEKLNCPRIWTWVMFFFYIFFIIAIVKIIIYFLVAYNISKCCDTGDVNKYI